MGSPIGTKVSEEHCYMGTYHSTRGRTLSCSSKVAIRTGIAPDGGLFVSDELGTQQVDISSLADKSYFEIAQDVLGMLLNDYTAEEISACVDEAYRGTFASEEVTPLVKLDAAPGADAPQTYVMELFGGPTSAFKDVALQMLPRLMARTSAKDGGAVKLTEKSANKFTFKMPGSKVTVEAVFVKEETKPVVTLPFADVNKGDWFYDAVEYVYSHDLMNGTSAAAFSPYLTTSRAMILTILARYDGVDTSTGSTWYEAGAAWAIAEGVSDGTNLEANLTREQLVTMLWRYAGSPVVESDLSGYPDSASVSDWAVNAMIWAVESGVITGNGAGALNPQGTATRAEVATILMRFIEK